jgi:hypothetical protein
VIQGLHMVLVGHVGSLRVGEDRSYLGLDRHK